MRFLKIIAILMVFLTLFSFISPRGSSTTLPVIPVNTNMIAINENKPYFRVNYPKEISALPKHKIARIESFVNTQMKIGKIPGMAVVIVKNDQIIYQKGFGFANIRKKQPITSTTLFELGSTSKAFTAFAILLLEEKGLLNVQDPVKKYIPWFKMFERKKITNLTLENLNRYIPWFYARQEVDITIEQLLHQTSGINWQSIADIPPSDTADSLEKTIRILMKKAMKPELDYYPGDRYSYATINYDILGLIIAYVSGRSYENFMKVNIFNPLGMNHTVLFRKQAGEKLATGYKVGFMRPLEYIAPVYRGNGPAGYIITCTDDMAKWLEVQLGTAKVAPLYQKIAAKSHRDDYDYSNGWFTSRIDDNLIIYHGGSNPNYSSFIELRPEAKLGIALLLNSNSNFTEGIGNGIINIINGRGRIPERLYDLYVDYDGISCLLILAVGIIIWLTIRLTINRYQKYHKYVGINGGTLTKLLIFSLLFGCFLIYYYFLPKIIFGFNWPFLMVWGPVTLIMALILIFTEILIVYLYLFNIFFFVNKVKHVKLKRRRSIQGVNR